jgi:hypothetical protein
MNLRRISAGEHRFLLKSNNRENTKFARVGFEPLLSSQDNGTPIRSSDEQHVFCRPDSSGQLLALNIG